MIYLVHAGVELLEIGSVIYIEENGLIFKYNDAFSEEDIWPG